MPDAPVYVVQTLSGMVVEMAVSLVGIPPQSTPRTEPFEICTKVSCPENPDPMTVTFPPTETVVGETELINIVDAGG